MNILHDHRNARRILAVCRVLDLQRKFLGFTLDVSREGIQIIINREFPSQSEFEIILTQGKESKFDCPDILIKIRTAWRISSCDEFDQIGGEIIEVDSENNLSNFIYYCENIEQEKYHTY